MTLQELKRPKVHVFIGGSDRGSEHSRFKRARVSRLMGSSVKEELLVTIEECQMKYWVKPCQLG